MSEYFVLQPLSVMGLVLLTTDIKPTEQKANKQHENGMA
jgi:hypothetical protein